MYVQTLMSEGKRQFSFAELIWSKEQLACVLWRTTCGSQAENQMEIRVGFESECSTVWLC